MSFAEEQATIIESMAENATAKSMPNANVGKVDEILLTISAQSPKNAPFPEIFDLQPSSSDASGKEKRQIFRCGP